MFADPLPLSTAADTITSDSYNGFGNLVVARTSNADNGKTVRIGPNGLVLTISHQPGKDNRTLVRFDKPFVDATTGEKRKASCYLNFVNPQGLNGASVDTDVMAFFRSSIEWFFCQTNEGSIDGMTPQLQLDRLLLLEP